MYIYIYTYRYTQIYIYIYIYVHLHTYDISPSSARYVSEWQKAKKSGKLPESTGQEIRPEMTLKEGVIWVMVLVDWEIGDINLYFSQV